MNFLWPFQNIQNLFFNFTSNGYKKGRETLPFALSYDFILSSIHQQQ